MKLPLEILLPKAAFLYMSVSERVENVVSPRVDSSRVASDPEGVELLVQTVSAVLYEVCI